MGTIFKRKRAKPWQAQVSRPGMPRLSRAFACKRSAGEWIKREEKKTVELLREPAENAARIRMRELFDRYEQHMLPQRTSSANTIRAQRCHLAFWRKEIGGMKVADIDVGILSHMRDQLVCNKRRKNSTANRYISTLSTVFKTALKEWQCATCNPVKELERLPEEEGRNSYAEKADIKALLAAASNDKSPHILPFLRLALGTGARKSEIKYIECRKAKLISA